MIFFALNAALALAWAALWGNFSYGNLAGGFIFGFAGLWFARRLIDPDGERGYFRALPQSFVLTAYFLKELVKSCIMVARDCIARKPRLRPAIVRFPIGPKSDLELFMLANLITLTPGTLTLDVAEDRSVLFIHSIYADDPESVIADLRTGMEHRVGRVFR